MYKFILKITKKLIHFIIFFQQKKIFILSIILLSMSVISWFLFQNKQDFLSKTDNSFYQKIADSTKLMILKTRNIFIKDNKINYVLDMMELSKSFLEKNQIDQAIEKINNAIQANNDPNIKSMLNIRIARMYVQQKQADLAIKYLNNINQDVWMPIKYNFLGEAMIIKKDINGAIEAWKKGIDYDTANYLKDIMIMKINNLQR